MARIRLLLIPLCALAMACSSPPNGGVCMVKADCEEECRKVDDYSSISQCTRPCGEEEENVGVGERCENGDVVLECSSQGDCPAGTACHLRVCRPECDSDVQCLEGSRCGDDPKVCFYWQGAPSE